MSAQRKKPKRATPKQPPLPLVTSENVLAALRRLGFVDGPAKSSSHRSMYRTHVDGRKDVTTVVLNQNPVPRGTLEGILKLADVSRAGFMRALGRKR